MNNELLFHLGAVLVRITILLLLAITLLGLLRRAEPRWRVLVSRAVYIALPLAILASVFVPRLDLPLLPPQPVQSSRTLLSVYSGPEATSEKTATAPSTYQRIDDAFVRNSLLLLWIGVSLLLAFREGFRLRPFTSKRLSEHTENADRRLAIAWRNVCASSGVRAPGLRVAAEQTSPYLAFGFSNILVIPRSLNSPDQLERLSHVFFHEAAHLAHRDRGWNLVARFLTCGFWFHPFAWCLESLHLRACEEACDAEAARRGDADAYAGALASLALELVPQEHPVTAFIRLPSVRDRIGSLREHARLTPPSRSKSLPLLAAIACLALVTSNLGIARKVAPTSAESQSATEEQLRTTILPSIEFRDTPVQHAVDYLRARSAELDTLGRGVNIILSREARASSKTGITLKLTNVPLVEAIRYTTKLANLSFRVDGSAVIIESSSESAAAETKDDSTSAAAPDAATQLVIEKLSSIIVPLVDVREAPLTDVINFLRDQSKKLDTETTDPRMKGINFLVMNGPKARTPVTLRLSNVPLMDALRYVTELSGTTLDIRPIGVVIKTEEESTSPVDKIATNSREQGLLYTIVFALPENTFNEALADSGKSSAKDLLIDIGVEFPPGSAAIYNPASDQLIIRNNDKQIKRIEIWFDGLKKPQP